MRRGQRKVARAQRKAFRKVAGPILKEGIEAAAPGSTPKRTRVTSTRSGGLKARPFKRSAALQRTLHAGRRPGSRPPPVSPAFKRWAARKGIDPRALYVVRQSIGRRGFRGRPWYGPAGDRAARRIKGSSAVRSELRAVARRDLMRTARRR